jgi:hypothetical protein
MTIVVGLERTYTIDEFMALPDDGYNYELVRGRLERISPPSASLPSGRGRSPSLPISRSR